MNWGWWCNIGERGIEKKNTKEWDIRKKNVFFMFGDVEMNYFYNLVVISIGLMKSYYIFNITNTIWVKL